MMKKFLSLLTVEILISTLILTVSAESSTLIKRIDNDTIDPDCTNNSWVFPTYLTVNPNLYNGDARRDYTKRPEGNPTYEWMITKGGISTQNYQPLYCQLSVWLYDDTFTDPQAKYYAGGRLIQFIMGKINQNLAPGGWNVLPTVEVVDYHATPGNTLICGASVTASGLSDTTWTGADCVEIFAYK